MSSARSEVYISRYSTKILCTFAGWYASSLVQATCCISYVHFPTRL